jgi:hypothetical protein
MAETVHGQDNSMDIKTIRKDEFFICHSSLLFAQQSSKNNSLITSAIFTTMQISGVRTGI